MRRLIPILVLLAGCADGLFRPTHDTIEIELERLPVAETMLLVGQSARLTARTSAGLDERVEWRSSDPAILRVDAGEVMALAVGDARVTATSGGLADTVFVSVLAALPADGYCSGGGLELARGEALTTTAEAAARLCIQGGERNQIYILVPFHAATSGSELRVEIRGRGIGDGSLARESPTPAPATARLSPLPTSPAPSFEFDRSLRERESRDLTPLIHGRASALPLPPHAALARIAEIGDTVTLNVNPLKTCTEPHPRRARVAAVSDRAVMLDDVTNPSGGFTDLEYAHFAEAFDDVIYPTIVQNFGEPSDIDGNGRITILFTATVNQLTGERSSEYVAGFFYARDLFPTADVPPLAGCAGSNESELLYMMTPDPSGVVNRNVRTKSFVTDRTLAVLAHELQHLVNTSRRLHVLGADPWSEEFWLNEGLSHVAEELMYYATTDTRPRSELTAPWVRGENFDEFEQFMSVNSSRYARYLENPSGTSALQGPELETRGASWSFLRYAADRIDGDETAFWRSLVDSEALGYANLGSAIGASPLSWMHDWAVSFYVDDFIPVDAKYRQRSWNFRSVLPTLGSGISSYPLRIEHVLDTDRLYRGTLVPAGAAILRFSIPAGSSARLDTTSGGESPPSKLRLTLLRTW